MGRRWLIALLPAALGLAIGVGLNLSSGPNPTLFMRAQLSAVAFLSGILLSIVAAAVVWMRGRMENIRWEADREADEERRQFLRRLDHELKNPLTAILAGLANLKAAETVPQRETALRSVEAQIQRMSRLVADLRKLADLETRPIDRDPVDVGQLLEEACSQAQRDPNLAGRQLTLSIPQAPWPLPKVAGDRDLLSLAIHNLLNNAIKFTEPGDRIEIRAAEENAGVLIEVADTGPGIRDEEMTHIWEELYRGQDARGVPGSGLGLALVRAIVIRHGGEVQLRSRAGQGTVFTVHLPAE
jgi:two-component system, OmpR family, sensor kinase